MLKDAIISDCGLYRYALTRVWDVDAPSCAFIMLNPSTADASEDDPTIRRCINFAKAWGYGSLVVGNLFAYRATSPADMKAAADPIGPLNDWYLQCMCEAVSGSRGAVVCAWGAHGAFIRRDEAVLDLIPATAFCIKRTKEGHPGHPLYLPKNLNLIMYP